MAVKLFPLVIIASVGIISFLLISSTAPIRGPLDNLFPKNSSQAAEVIPNNCPDSLQARINAAPPGSTITLNQSCVYREEITITKSITLDGGKAAQIRGSDIWTSWNQTGSTWTSTQTVPLTNNNYNDPDGRCAKDECYYPHQVFIDGVKQKLVLGRAPQAGEFSVDQNFKTGPLNPARIILGTNPFGKTVEVTTRYWWISGNLQPSDNVTVKNFVMKHAGTNGNKGSIDIHRCNNCQPIGQIRIEGNDLSYSHGANVALYANTKFLNNDTHHADNFGIGTGDNVTDNKSSILIQNNKIHDNALDGLYNPGWGSGGLKNGGLTNSIIDGNLVYNNRGIGLWCDIACKNITYSNNVVYDTTGAGIMFEISDGVKIFGNKIWKNGFGDNQNWVMPAGILVSTSANAEVYNNIVAWNARGISLVWQNRADRMSNAGIGNFVHDNKIIQSAQNINYYWANTSLAWVQEQNGPVALPSSNNRGINNLYWYDQQESYFSSINNPQFYWPDTTGGYLTLSNFNNTPAEEGGRYLTGTEKDNILAQNLMPACPSCGIPTPQPTTRITPSPTPARIPGDIVAPFGIIDIHDFNQVVTDYDKQGSNILGDVTNNTGGGPDGKVDIHDFNLVVSNYGRSN